MPTLAHESNPKEDSIAISTGDVLSTAQLDVVFLFPGDSGPSTPPLTPNPFNASSSCPAILAWPSDRDPIPFFYNDGLSGGAITVFSDAQPDNAPFDDTNSKWLKIDVRSSPQCCGAVYRPFHMIDIPTMVSTDDQVFPVHDLQNWTCTVGAISPTLYAGICAWVEDGSTYDDFTGYVLAANFELGITQFMKYVHQSLCNDGTILGTITAVPTAAGDVMTISVYTDPNGASVGDTIWQLIAELRDSSGSHLGNSPIDLQTHDELMDVEYTFTGRGNVFIIEENVKPVVRYVFYNADGSPVYSTRQTALIDDVYLTPAGIQQGHRHNRANVGFVALGNHFLGGTLRFAANTAQFGHTCRLDSYSFGTGAVS